MHFNYINLVTVQYLFTRVMSRVPRWTRSVDEILTLELTATGQNHIPELDAVWCFGVTFFLDCFSSDLQKCARHAASFQLQVAAT